MSEARWGRYVLVISSDRTQILHSVEYFLTLYLHRGAGGGERRGNNGVLHETQARDRRLSEKSAKNKGKEMSERKLFLLPIIVITDIPPPGRLSSEDEHVALPKGLSNLRKKFDREFGIYSINVLRGSPFQTKVRVPVLRVEVIRSFSKFRDVIDAITEGGNRPGGLEGIILFPVKGMALNLTLLRIMQAIRDNVGRARREGRNPSRHIPWIVVGAYNVRSMDLISICSESKDLYSPMLQLDRGFPITLGDSIRVFYSPSAEIMASAALAFARGRRNPYELPIWGYACIEREKLYEGLHELIYARPPAHPTGVGGEGSSSIRSLGVGDEGGFKIRIRSLSTHLCPKGRSQDLSLRSKSEEGLEGDEEINGFLELDLELYKYDGSGNEKKNDGDRQSERGEVAEEYNLRGITIVGPKIVRGIRDRMSVRTLERENLLELMVDDFVDMYVERARRVCFGTGESEKDKINEYLSLRDTHDTPKCKDEVRRKLVNCFKSNFRGLLPREELDSLGAIEKRGLTEVRSLLERVVEEICEKRDGKENIWNTINEVLGKMKDTLTKPVLSLYVKELRAVKRTLELYLSGSVLRRYEGRVSDKDVQKYLKEYIKSLSEFTRPPYPSDPGFYLFKMLASIRPSFLERSSSEKNLFSLDTRFGELGTFTLMPDSLSLRGYLNCPVSRGVQWTWIRKGPEKGGDRQNSNQSRGKIYGLPCHSPRASAGGAGSKRRNLTRRMIKMYVCFNDSGPGTLILLLRNLGLGISSYEQSIGVPLIDLMLVREAPCPFGNHLIEFVGNMNLLRRRVLELKRILPNQVLIIEGPLIGGEPAGGNGKVMSGSSDLSAGNYARYLEKRLNDLAGDYGYRYVIYSSENGRVFLLRRIPDPTQAEYNSPREYIPYCDFVVGCPFAKPEVKVFW